MGQAMETAAGSETGARYGWTAAGGLAAAILGLGATAGWTAAHAAGLALTVDRAILAMLANAPAKAVASHSPGKGVSGGSQAQSTAGSAPSRLAALPRGLVLAYVQGNLPQADGVTAYLPALTGIVPAWYTLQADGAVTGSTDAALLEAARKAHLWRFALVQAASPTVYAGVFGQPAKEERAIADLLGLARQYAYDGVNLDLEAIPPAEGGAFLAFVKNLARALHQAGYLLTVSVPAKVSAAGDSWSAAYSYRQLGQVADLVMIMAYDQHYPGGSPGPIAATSWVNQVVRYAVSRIAPAKLVLGVPGYGYDWAPGAPAHALTYAQAMALRARYAPHATGNHFSYRLGGVTHQVWFDNLHTFMRQVQLASGYELRGIALWRLGLEDPKIWNALQ